MENLARYIIYPAVDLHLQTHANDYYGDPDYFWKENIYRQKISKSKSSDMAALEKLIPDPCNLFIFQVFFKSHHPVDNPARRNFHDPVCHSGDKFTVVGAE
jgi:hypothetical protein